MPIEFGTNKLQPEPLKAGGFNLKKMANDLKDKMMSKLGGGKSSKHEEFGYNPPVPYTQKLEAKIYTNIKHRK